MKTLIVLLPLLLMARLASAQASTKIYFVTAPNKNLVTTLNPDKPIRIGRCTLVETNADSLGIVVTSSKTVYLHFERGRTYYYRALGGSTSYLTTAQCSQDEFWLNVAFNGTGTYRHYFLDKESGLKLIEETR